MELLIKNGLVVSPEDGLNARADIYVKDGKIAEIGENLNISGALAIDAQGLAVFPGLVDMHAHFREPGYEYKEDILSGSRAAAAGGYTSVCCMPNTKPVADNAAVVQYIINKAKETPCHVYPIAAITKNQEGRELTEMGELLECGAVAFSDDGRPVESSRMMRLAMQYLKGLDKGFVISHCEDISLTDGGVMNEGSQSTLLGLKGAPGAAEALMVAREALLAELLGVHVHIAHVSCAQSVNIIRDFKARNVKITCETCPHYICACDEDVNFTDANTKVNPPLRSREDVEAIKQALCEGVIDCIATDHAPHHADEKNVEFNLAASGISGLETSFALCYTQLVRGGLMDLSRLIGLMSASPAKIAGLKAGRLRLGMPADITIADLEQPFIIDTAKFKSKGKNNPFNAREVYGKIKYTLLEGKIVYKSEN